MKNLKHNELHYIHLVKHLQLLKQTVFLVYDHQDDCGLRLPWLEHFDAEDAGVASRISG